MKGDFTRQTFRPANHFSSVRLQQGRVQVDADWNEQVDIQAHAERTATGDMVGRTGAPEEGGGFEIDTLGFAGSLRGVSLYQQWGFAVGDGGVVLDGLAAGWYEASSGTSATLRAVHTTADGTGPTTWAVGDRGVILSRRGVGAGGWARYDTPGVIGALRAVHFVDPRTGWAVGDRGTIVTTTTGGQEGPGGTPPGWSAERPPDDTRVTLRGVHFVDQATGWAVGDRATIIARKGNVWSAQFPPAGSKVTANLRAVHFVDAANGCVVGDGGTVLVTDDGGRSWKDGKSGVTVTLRAVTFLDAGRGWAVGDGATILATEDGGRTWRRQAVPDGVTATLRAVAFGDGRGAAVGDDGTALSTDDGGKSWVRAEAGGQGLTVTAGRFYVDGILCENEHSFRVTQQPDLPELELPDPGASSNFVRQYLFYLDVWERHLTAVERPDIREVALGGPDTATRTRTVAQVRWEEVDPASERCGGPGWMPSGRTNSYMAARAAPATDTGDVCLVPPGGGYRRLENQLYRVEIHGPDADGRPTFKWSRDNGSVLARLDRVDADRLAISGPGPDAVGAFDGAPWVEVTDEERTLTVGHGDLVQLASAQGGKLLPVDPAAVGPRGSVPVVRRWDGVGTVEGGWLALEDGVEIAFGSIEDTYRPGDYWLVPARSLTATVDWPRDENGPVFQPPHGIEHHYAVLAEARPSNTGWGLRDCRRRFASLTELSRTRPVEPAVHVTSVSVRRSNPLSDERIRNGGAVQVSDLHYGVGIAFDRRVDPLPLSAACLLTIDVPFPLTDADRRTWDRGLVGYQPMVLDSTIYTDDESNTIYWLAATATNYYLASLLQQLVDLSAVAHYQPKVRAHLRLRGNFVWAADDLSVWLDGDTFGTRDTYLDDVNLVEAGGRISGDGRRGGDFAMWFDIVPDDFSFDARSETQPSTEEPKAKPKPRPRRPSPPPKPEAS